MAAIKNDLHCNSVSVFGTDLGRLEEAATIALEHDLQVMLQPHLVEAERPETLVFLKKAARMSEALHAQGHRVTLNIGCELSIFTPGIVSGRNHAERMTTIASDLSSLPAYNEALNELLADIVEVARTHFSGKLIYGGGLWERVDWEHFNFVGLNHYRASWNEATYVADLRAFQTLGKPIIITEFGCWTYHGADELGGGGNVAVDWGVAPPRVHEGYARSETVQATYLTDLLDIFQAEGIYGAYVFEFMEPYCPHTQEPTYDLDVASFDIAKVLANPPGDARRIYWQPKQSFSAAAERYRV